MYIEGEEEENLEEIELEEDLFDDDEGEEAEEETDDTDVDVEDEEQGEGQDSNDDEDFKDKETLLNALNRERRLRKEAEKKAKTKQNEASEQSTYQSLIEAGVDKNIAKTIVEMNNKSNEEIAEIKFKNSVLELSRKNEFSDIENYVEDIKPFVDKGLTLEQAYYAVTGGKKHTRTTEAEIKRQLEAKMLNNSKRAKALDVDTTGSNDNNNTTTISKPKYTALEQKLAKVAGIPVEEYVAFKNISSQDDYQSYKKKKSKK